MTRPLSDKKSPDNSFAAQKRLTLHPSTVFLAAFCAVIVVIVKEKWQVSLGILLVAMTLAFVTSRSWMMPAATLGLSFPTALSMVLIHAPYGHQPIAPFLTADGLTTAGILTVRFAALMGCILAAVTMTNVVDVAKWLQTSWVGYKVAFIVGTALQFLPEGRRAVDKINDANFLAGRPLKRHQLAIPVIAKLIVQGTERGAALAALGFDRPGKRTLLRPVPDRRAEKAFRIAVVIGTVLWLFK